MSDPVIIGNAMLAHWRRAREAPATDGMVFFLEDIISAEGNGMVDSIEPSPSELAGLRHTTRIKMNGR